MPKKCPKCKSTSFVVESRDESHRIMRRRHCSSSDCRHRYSTYEVTAETYKQLKQISQIKIKINELLNESE